VKSAEKVAYDYGQEAAEKLMIILPQQFTPREIAHAVAVAPIDSEMMKWLENAYVPVIAAVARNTKTKIENLYRNFWEGMGAAFEKAAPEP